MAARTPPTESAYERRIRRYLAAHPGATRQDARGHKQAAGSGRGAEYQGRVKRAEAAGKRGPAARGQRGRAAFLAYIRPGDLVLLDVPVGQIEIDSRGRFVAIPKLVVPDNPRRRPRTFVIRNLSRDGLAAMIRAELDRGANLTPVPSLDQRKLLPAGKAAA